MKKNLKYILIFVGFVLIVFFVKNTINQKFDKGVNINNSKWEKDYPKIFNNSGYSKLIESKGILNKLKNNPESLQELQGKITNQFGIRDDILEYILSLNLDERNNYSALKIAQTDTYIYFVAKNKTDALIYSKYYGLSLTCLSIYYPQWLKISRHIDSMMRDTKSRDKRMWWVDNNYFSYQVIGTGLSVADENKKCKELEY